MTLPNRPPASDYDAQLDALKQRQRTAYVRWFVVPFCAVLVVMALLAVWSGPPAPPVVPAAPSGLARPPSAAQPLTSDQAFVVAVRRCMAAHDWDAPMGKLLVNACIKEDLARAGFPER
jgi:hypothetical protein